MKNIKFEYDQTNELKSLIEQVYFIDGDNGRLLDTPSDHLILNQDNLYYQVLTGLDYGIKIRNNDLIEGSMNFNMIENNDTIELVPSSKYCVKTSDNKDKKEKYSFY